MDIYQVPVIFRYLVSTENNSANHITYIQVSLNFEKMRARMLNRYLTSKNINVAKPDTFLNAGELLQVNAQITALENNLSGPDYTMRLMEAQRVMEAQRKMPLEQPDSLQLNNPMSSQKLEAARQFIHKDDSLRNTLNALKDSRRDIQIEQNRRQHLQDMDQMKLQSDTRYLKKKLKANKQLTTKDEVLLNIRKLDIGQFAPVYSELALNGVSVRGVNIEYVPGNFYVSACTGKILAPVLLQQENRQQHLTALRAGIGNYDKRYIGIILTKTKNTANSIYNDSSGYLLKDGDALHYGLQGGFNYLKKFTSEFEYIIKSAPHNAASGRAEDFSTIPNKYDMLNNQAFQVRSTLNLPAAKNSIEYLLRRTGSFYWAAGAPFLRRDVIRHQVKFKQKIYKTRISFSAMIRTDKDNMSGYKATTTSSYQMNYALNLNFRRLPYAVISVSPNHMEMKGEIGSKPIHTINSIIIYSVLAGKNYHVKDIGFNTTANISRYESITTSIGNTKTHVLDLLNRIDFFSIGLSINSHFNQNLDGTKGSPVWGKTIENTIEKQLGKTSSVRLGQHIRNSPVQRMNGINLGFTLDGKKYGKLNLTFELSEIKNIYFAPLNYRQQYFLRLNYTFNLNNVK